MFASTSRGLVAACMFLVLFCSGISRADVLDVPGDFPLIQAAIDASVDGDTVLVQPGVYRENLQIGVEILVTGVAPRDSEIVANTVIDGSARGNCVLFRADAELVGFSITNSNYAGGIATSSGDTVVVRHCVIHGNRNSGIIVVQDVSARIEDCELRDNNASAGGAIYIRDGGIATINNSLVRNNKATWGGGIRVTYPSKVIAFGVDFISNTSTEEGGAVYAEDTYRVAQEFEHCRFIGNSSDLGGAVSLRSCDGAFTNCIVEQNHSTDRGALWICEGGTTLIDNCTVMYNTSDVVNSGGVVVYGQTTGHLRNTILGDNLPSQLYYGGGATGTVTYSDVEGGWPGEGNIDADPLFRSYGGFDYLLNLGSPAIDAGDPTVEDGVYDAHPKWPNWYPNGARSDMGAYGGPENEKWLSRN